MSANADDVDFGRLKEVLASIAEDMDDRSERGRVADYIPELAAIDAAQFGIAVSLPDGRLAAAGDATKSFSIQSISKVFALELALEAFRDAVWTRVGREPSGDPYNSIVDLERHKGIPRNPFINPGALVVVDLLIEAASADGARDAVWDFIARQIGAERMGIDEKVAGSEQSAGFTNRALANLAKSFGNLRHDVEDVMRAYVRQCAIALSCRELAAAGQFLVIDREEQDLGISRRDALRRRRILSLMLTCGQYDGSGDFAFRVGLPAKSGVGGGILAIVPNRASIAVWSPGLDENGNSLLGTAALERLVERMDWSIFGSFEN